MCRRAQRNCGSESEDRSFPPTIGRFRSKVGRSGQRLLGGGVEVDTNSSGMYGNGPVTGASSSSCPRTFKSVPAEGQSGVPDVAIPLNSEGSHGSARRKRMRERAEGIETGLLVGSSMFTGLPHRCSPATGRTEDSSGESLRLCQCVVNSRRN